MKNDTGKLAAAAIIGALYAVLTMMLAPVSYGPLQFRLSEVLCILPYFMPFTAWGLFFGCAAANLISAAGVIDIVFGSLATLIAGALTALCGRKSRGSIKSQILACLSPVLINALFVGGALYYVACSSIPFSLNAFLLGFAGPVALSELVVLFAVGLPLMRKLPTLRFFRELLTKLG